MKGMPLARCPGWKELHWLCHGQTVGSVPFQGQIMLGAYSPCSFICSCGRASVRQRIQCVLLIVHVLKTGKITQFDCSSSETKFLGRSNIVHQTSGYSWRKYTHLFVHVFFSVVFIMKKIFCLFLGLNCDSLFSSETSPHKCCYFRWKLYFKIIIAYFSFFLCFFETFLLKS